ncbi:hypothetical protein ABZ477_18930 [Microbacterium sp. NPDC019599]|uniref:hypothetical protein n=1 Tax=Microbacterium sp. NPDC019599 TaxID=3154690 RepID=UPI0033EAA793
MDARHSCCEITSHGRAIVAEVTERRRVHLGRVLGEMDGESRRKVVEGLDILSRHVGEPSPEQLMVLGL